MMMFVRKYFLYILLATFLLVIIAQRINKPGIPDPIVKTVTDTSWKYDRDTIPVQGKPILVQSIPTVVTVHDTAYIPDTSYIGLKHQYEALVSKYLAKNLYSDSLKIDTLGYVALTDTVSKNLLAGRSFKYSIKYPVITKTTTITNPPVRQVFIGLEADGTKPNLIQQFGVGLIYKDRKDRMFGLRGGIDVSGNYYVGAGLYWKIHL